jgi:hypothetical protein
MWNGWRRRAMKTTVYSVATLVLLLGCASWSRGGLRNAWWYLGGLRLVCTPTEIVITPTESRAKSVKVNESIQITNLTGSQISIIGGTSSCSCTALGEIPTVIKDGQSVPFSIEIDRAGMRAGLTVDVVLFFDHPQYQSQKIRVKSVGADSGAVTIVAKN